MERLTIVGGGSAGWIAAFLISKLRKDFDITLIESSEILSVGVGEGTTGRFLEIFNRENLGIDLTDFLKSLQALPKMGINFVNWTDMGDFMSPISGSETTDTYIDYISYYGHLSNRKISEYNESAFYAKNGYSNFTKNLQGKYSINEFFPAIHLDAGSLVKYFRDLSKANGVKHVVDTVENVTKEFGNIVSIQLKNVGEYTSDFFIDCTGFQRKLMQDLEWIDYSQYLPIDRGLPFRLKEDNAEKHAYTNAIAMDSGWVWEIPTKNKIGRGYCFSSKYTDEETCLKELENLYQTEVEKIKTIEFSSGRMKNVLSGNCLAIGLSAAFFEPLQATSLHCTLQQIDDFIFTFIDNKSINLDSVSVDAYNQRYARMYDDMKDFIFVHYTGGKTNTEFWKHFTKVEYPEQVSKLLYLNNKRLLRDYDVERYHGSVGVALWIPTLFGLGHFNKETAERILSCDVNFSSMDKYMDTFNAKLKHKISTHNYQSIKDL